MTWLTRLLAILAGYTAIAIWLSVPLAMLAMALGLGLVNVATGLTAGWDPALGWIALWLLSAVSGLLTLWLGRRILELSRWLWRSSSREIAHA